MAEHAARRIGRAGVLLAGSGADEVAGTERAEESTFDRRCKVLRPRRGRPVFRKVRRHQLLGIRRIRNAVLVDSIDLVAGRGGQRRGHRATLVGIRVKVEDGDRDDVPGVAAALLGLAIAVPDALRQAGRARHVVRRGIGCEATPPVLVVHTVEQRRSRIEEIRLGIASVDPDVDDQALRSIVLSEKAQGNVLGLAELGQSRTDRPRGDGHHDGPSRRPQHFSSQQRPPPGCGLFPPSRASAQGVFASTVQLHFEAR